MNEKMITSRENVRVRHAVAVRDRKVPDEIFIEGVRLCEEAVVAQLTIKDVLYTEEMAGDERGAQLLAQLRGKGAPVALVSRRIFASISDTKTPQGLVVLATQPERGPNALERRSEDAPLLVIIHRLNNPSNAGAILRAAEAAGATGIITTVGTTDIFSAKALRGAMGATFRLPLWTGVEFQDAVKWCSEHGIRTICADVRAESEYTESDWTSPRALIVGPEANGLSADEMRLADEALKIPMRTPVESLNVAVAAAIILYEAARQRDRNRAPDTFPSRSSVKSPDAS